MPFTGLVRRVLPQDLLDFTRILSVCFEFSVTEELDADAFYKAYAAKSADSLDIGGVHLLEKYVAEYDGQLIAGMLALPYTVEFDGGDMRMCGIGGVGTLPTYRRMGAVRAMINKALHDEYEKGTEWSFLYPFSQSYYEKFGYALSEPELIWSLSLRHITPFKNDSYSFSMHKGGDDGLSDFCEAYERMSGFNMMIRRKRCDYGKIISADPYKRNDYAYLCRDGEGRACGYTVFHKLRESGRTVMQMTELVFDKLQTLHAILNFAAGFASDYDTVRFSAPYCLNLEPLCVDYTTAQLQRTVKPYGMMRVIHLENALRGAKLIGTGEASLQVDDPTLEKQYRIGLSWRDGKLTDMGSTSLPSDADLSIGAFSSLLLGRCGISDFPYLVGAEFTQPHKLAGLFYKKPIHIKNHF